MLNSIIFNYLKIINHKYTFKTIIFIHFVKQSIIILLSFLILSTFKVSAKEIIVEARISKNKKAMTMPGDYIGKSTPVKIGSSNYILIKINSIVTGE